MAIVLVIVGLVALALRLSFVLGSPTVNAREAMQDFHDVIGVNLVTGHGFSYQEGVSQPTVARAPLFPVVLGATYAVAGDGRPWGLWRVMDALVDTATAVLLVVFVLQATRLRLRRRVPDRDDCPDGDTRDPGSLWIAGCAGLIYAVQPLPIRWAGLLTPETWMALWTVVSALAFVGWMGRPTYRRASLVGLSLALLMLTKSVGLGLPVLATVAGIVVMRRWGSRSRATLVSALLIAVVAYSIIVPWTVRNYAVSDSFIPIQTLTWYNFWVDWTMDDPPRAVEPFPLKVEPYPLPAHLLEPRQDVYREAWLRDRALEWVRANPGALVAKMWHNFLEFWYYVPGAPQQLTRGELAYLLQLVLAAAGSAVALARPRLRPLGVLCLVITGYYALLYTPFSVLVRYSLPTMPFTAALASVALVTLTSLLIRRVRARSSGSERSPMDRSGSSQVEPDGS